MATIAGTDFSWLNSCHFMARSTWPSPLEWILRFLMENRNQRIEKIGKGPGNDPFVDFPAYKVLLAVVSESESIKGYPSTLSEGTRSITIKQTPFR